MSLHINRFVDRVKAADSRTQREVTLTLNEAKDLHADITKLLNAVAELQSIAIKSKKSDETVEVQLDGGDF